MAYDGRFEVHDLYRLKILEHVEESPRLSNRRASRILGVSVKLAHEVLSRLIDKGLVHILKHHSRRWDYFLTPKGIAEKARLSMGFLDFSMHFYRQARRLSAQLCRDLSEAGERRVSFLGANDLAEIVYLGVEEWGLTLAAVYDDDARRDNFIKLPIRPLAELPQDKSDAIIVCCYDTTMPMRARFLPANVAQNAKMHWVFDQEAR